MGLGEAASGCASATAEFTSDPTWLTLILGCTGDSLASPGSASVTTASLGFPPSPPWLSGSNSHSESLLLSLLATRRCGTPLHQLCTAERPLVEFPPAKEGWLQRSWPCDDQKSTQFGPLATEERMVPGNPQLSGHLGLWS